jgi:hypothetical protein
LYSSPNIIRQIKSRIRRWVGHVARMGEERKGFGGKPPRKETTRKTKAWMGVWDKNGSKGDWMGVCSGFSWLRIENGGGLL